MLSEKDQRDLKRLEISHYVGAVLQIGVVAYYWFALEGQMQSQVAQAESDDQRRILQALADWMPVVATTLTSMLIPTLLAAGVLVRLGKARKALYGLVAVNCVFSPVGIFVGIATLILLQRPDVNAWFRRGERPSRPGDLLHVE